ncbi:MAG TPA: MG2 domain-containing protein [Chitinophagaceae bacterium]|jgi:hypothetical protein|nr:MG2 domain-containing protein [Chitinophagaceae bacterium]
MRIHTLPAGLLWIVLLLSACNRNYVTVDTTTARDEVPQLGNLVFRFNKPLMADSLLHTWDSTEYVTFKPAIRGRFRWESPDELVFSPSAPLLPATEYTATVEDAVLRFSEYDDLKEGETKFHTAPLKLEDTRVSWVPVTTGGRPAEPQIGLLFNYPVHPDALKEKLQVEVDGKTLPAALQTLAPSREVLVRLTGFNGGDRDYEAKITLEKGLVPEGGRKAVEEALRSSVSIPSPYVLQIDGLESEHDGTEGLVHIRTSQQLAGEGIAQHIRFEPAVAFSVQPTETGVTLRSAAFNSENAYALVITPGLRGAIGGVLKEEYNGQVAFGELEADIRFRNSKAVYLSRQGSGNVEVRITNVPKVKLVISRIYENNLLQAQSQGYYPRTNDGEAEYASDEGGEDYSAQLGDVVYSKEIETRSLPKSGTGRILNISQFEDRLPEARGIYHVQIRSATDYWVSDSRFISLSDIGLIAKKGADKIHVFANSIKTARSLEGVNIAVYGANNQLLGTGATDGEGVAVVTVPQKEFAGFRPAMVIARTDRDFNYLPFGNTQVNTSRFDVGGKRGNPTGLDAFINAERDIYRPGERVNFSVILRDRQWKSPGPLPVKMKFLQPNGKELKSFRKSLNEQGAADGSVDIAASAITGAYLLELYSSNDVLLAARSFMIEEFVPDRIKLTARLDKSFLQPGTQANLSLNAVNFFGPPAAGRNWEAEIQVAQKAFRAKAFPDYDFTLANQQSFFDKQQKEGTTDAAGNAVIPYEVPALYANSGLLQASFYSTVFDETGRPVSRHTKADIFTQDVFHGIRDDGYHYYALNQPVGFSLVSVNREGAAVSAGAHIKLIKHEYRTVLVKSGSYFRYESQQEVKLIQERDMMVGKGTVYSFVPRSPGDYELRICRPGANAYVSKRFYSYGSWGGGNSSFEVDTEGQVDIELDKDKYQAGQTARLLFKTPFSGRLLVTLERDGVLLHRYLEVADRTASLELPLEAAHVPNVYVTATLIKPHELSGIPLTVAHGFRNIPVEETDRKIPVQITAAASVRSRTRQKVRVKAVPGAYVTLAAVDNGVLQVSGFETPDPYAHYYQKQALGVAAFDLYPLLFPELRVRSSTGGDGNLDMDKRVNPMPARRFKLMSYWSGLRKADGSGVAEFEFDLPPFTGQIRLMAVAFRDSRFGSAESTTTVADPLVLSTALPRFLSPGDTVLVPVSVSNTTARPASGTAALELSGPVQVVGASRQAVSVAPNSEGQALFQVVAAPQIGVAKIRVKVQALGEAFMEENEISVRPPSTLQQLSGSGSVVAGQTGRIAFPTADFLPGSTGLELVVSRSPVAELADHLRYLVQYPYGCTEQTISAAFPQLYYADFSDLLQEKGPSRRLNAAGHVLEAIRRIKMRQLYNGAVTLWDGEGQEDWWTTAYAAHFLLEARKAGFDVENSLLETMLSYLANRMKHRETITYHYNRDQQKKIAPKEVPYSLFVLSLAGRSSVSAMNYYKGNPQLLALDGRYLLAASYAVAGDKRSFGSLLPSAFSGEESVQQTGGSFYSPVRDAAIALDVLLDADPGHPQVPQLARLVRDRLKSDRYLNTQERAFSFLALGKMARAEARATATAEIRSGGKVIGRMEGAPWKGGRELLAGGSAEISTKGSGRVYYSWLAEGISRTGAYREEDQYLKVRRAYFDRNGRELSGNVFRQNDLVIVRVTLEKTFSSAIENVVITDLLPAGFEIENPRTKEIPGMDWIKNAGTPVALDVRDDRFHFFVDATEGKQTYYYAVRAVSPGTFRQGPVSADALYNGALHSYHGAGVIQVVR